MQTIRSEATKIASSVNPEFAIDPVTVVTVITTLLPMLLKCFAASGATQSPKAYLKDHYDESTQSFDQWLIERTRSRTRVAARRAGHTHLDRGQLDAMTEAAFRRALEAPEATLTTCLSEAAQMTGTLE